MRSLFVFLAGLVLSLSLVIAACSEARPPATGPVTSRPAEPLVESNKPLADSSDGLGVHLAGVFTYLEQAYAWINTNPQAKPLVPTLDKVKGEAQGAVDENTVLKNLIVEQAGQLAERVKLDTERDAQLGELVKDNAALTGDLAKSHAATEAAKAKYSESWFGGRFWFWLTTVSIITALSIVAGLILNAKTDIFVYPIKFFGWIAGKLFSH